MSRASESEPFLRRRQVAPASGIPTVTTTALRKPGLTSRQLRSAREQKEKQRLMQTNQRSAEGLVLRRIDCCSLVWFLIMFIVMVMMTLYMAAFWCGLIRTGPNAISGGYCEKASNPTTVIYQAFPAIKHNLRAMLKLKKDFDWNVKEAVMSSRFAHVRMLRDYQSQQREKNEENSEDSGADSLLSERKVSMLVYSRVFNDRVGDVCQAMDALHQSGDVHKTIVVEDSTSLDALHLWSMEMGLSSGQSTDGIGEDDWYYDERTEELRHRSHGKTLMRTLHIGLWRAFERASKLLTPPSFIQSIRHSSPMPEEKKQRGFDLRMGVELKEEKEEKTVENRNLIVFLDTKHRMSMEDEWLSDAIQLFDKFPNLKVLGGYTGVIKHGTTISDLSMGVVDVSHNNKRDTGSNRGKETFTVLDNSDENLYGRLDLETENSWINNLRRHYHSSEIKQRIKEWSVHYGQDQGVDLTALLSRLGIEKDGITISDDSWMSYLKPALNQTGWLKNSDDDGRLSELNDPLSDVEPRYDAYGQLIRTPEQHRLEEWMFKENLEKIQREGARDHNHEGDESVDEWAKDGWDIVLEELNAKLKSRLKYYRQNHPNKRVSFDESAKKKMDRDFHTQHLANPIPFETEIIDTFGLKIDESKWKENPEYYSSKMKNSPHLPKKRVPFMFISAVRMGPLIVREDWWFQQLLPHLMNDSNFKSSANSELRGRVGLNNNVNSYFLTLDPDWFDIEISLWTNILGGNVGLYQSAGSFEMKKGKSENHGWLYDLEDVKEEVLRNQGLDNKFEFYVSNHAEIDPMVLGYNVWNVTHFVKLNSENKGIMKRHHPRKQTSLDDTSNLLDLLKDFEEAM